jgi:CheY-like chemotaxis protein
VKIVHVLLVDDDPVIRKYVSGVLESDHLGVETAADGNEALEKLRQFHPELIIADVHMPGMDGYELCRRIRQEQGSDIPFFFCSALGIGRQRVKGLELGADDYLVKPIDIDELRVKVRRQLERNDLLRTMRREIESKSVAGLLSGNLREVSLSDVLQLLEARGGGDFEVVVSEPGRSGSVFVTGTTIQHCELGNLGGLRALEKMLRWKEGKFRVETQLFFGPPTVGRPIGSALLEAFSVLDEIERLEGLVRQAGSERSVVEPAAPADLSALDGPERQIHAIAAGGATIEELLDRSPLDTLESCRIASELFSKGFLVAARE